MINTLQSLIFLKLLVTLIFLFINSSFVICLLKSDPFLILSILFKLVSKPITGNFFLKAMYIGKPT